MQQYNEDGAQIEVESDEVNVSGFETTDREYVAIRDGVALVDRSYRRVLTVSGEDRTSWLHNLTTNHVKSLGVGDGNYAFSLDVKGRILFDMNILMREQAIWLDLDQRFLEKAKAHLSKFIIMEDVTLVDSSDEYVRIGLTGGGLKTWLKHRQAEHIANLPMLGSSVMTIGGVEMDVWRTDFCGVFGVELFTPEESAVSVWKQLTDEVQSQAAIPVGGSAVQVHRIEAGLAWSGCEITEDYVPAETGQSERAVAVSKGCYLGQEVVERMRSREVVARRLMSLVVEAPTLPTVGDRVCDSAGQTVGKVTSVCLSLANGKPLALAYVRSSSTSDTTLTIEGEKISRPVGVVAVVTSAH